VSESSEIVGGFEDGTTCPAPLTTCPHGFVMRKEAFRTAEPPGALTSQALGINAAGWIVGTYVGGTPLKRRGFVMTP
jgi:hypothetical protein